MSFSPQQNSLVSQLSPIHFAPDYTPHPYFKGIMLESNPQPT